MAAYPPVLQWGDRMHMPEHPRQCSAHLCCAGRCEAEGEAVAEGDDSQAVAEQHDKCAESLVQGPYCGGILLQAGQIVSARSLHAAEIGAIR